MTTIFMNAFYEAYAHAKKKPWVVPHLSWKTLQLFNQQVIWSCVHRPRISQGWPIGDGSGPGRPVKGVWHDQLANSSLPYCRYASIVSLEEKIVFNSLMNLQDMYVKDFIYIALACKWPPNYLIQSSGWPSFFLAWVFIWLSVHLSATIGAFKV